MSASEPAPVILWFREDLRLDDNPALTAAAASGRPVLPVYVLDAESAGIRTPGAASRWWLHHSLAALAAALHRRGAELHLSRGPAAATIAALAAANSASAVYWNRSYTPAAVARDRGIKEQLHRSGLDVRSFNARLLWEPWEIATKDGGPYGVFTPFWKAMLAKGEPPAPLPSPEKLTGAAIDRRTDRLDSWNLLPTKPDWSGGLRESWQPGEEGAISRLYAFLEDGAAEGYETRRDVPGIAGTSRLSPHLHFGEIGPRRIWHAVKARVAAGHVREAAATAFLRELAWRDFNHHLLFHAPDLAVRNLRTKFDAMPWRDDPEGLARWQQGRTGYPLVDAGMAELWTTGWMHNRVRMVAASLLVKHLLIQWQAGEAWFWDTLVDADLANNTANWQWVAGSGADAAPFFRIFNPVLQGQRFDPDGAYVRRWVPALARLPDRHLHMPWAAPEPVLRAAGIALGRDYPAPIVDHGQARHRALAAFQSISGH